MSDIPVKVLFFARLREELETDSLATSVAQGATIADLLAQLAARGGHWAQLEGPQPVMAAVNQTMARAGTTLAPGDEVAFFPPVTGG